MPISLDEVMADYTAGKKGATEIASKIMTDGLDFDSAIQVMYWWLDNKGD